MTSSTPTIDTLQSQISAAEATFFATPNLIRVGSHVWDQLGAEVRSGLKSVAYTEYHVPTPNPWWDGVMRMFGIAVQRDLRMGPDSIAVFMDTVILNTSEQPEGPLALR